MSDVTGITCAPTRWPGGRAAALSFTFDDGYRESLGAVAALERRGWPCTFAVPVDFPDRGALPDSCTGGGPCVTWTDLRRMVGAGHEVCSHSRSHPVLPDLPDDALEEEVARSRLLLSERLEARAGETFVYPFGRSCARSRALVERHYGSGRGTRLGLNGSTPDLACTDSASVLHVMRPEVIGRWTRQAIEAEAWFVQTYHAVVPEDDPLWRGEYLYAWSLARFEDALARVAEHADSLWIATHEAVARYIRRREAARPVVTSLGGGRARVEVHVPRGDGGLADAPALTLAIRGPVAAALSAEGPPARPGPDPRTLLVDVEAGATTFHVSAC